MKSRRHWDSPLVQQAIVDMEKILDKWKEKELTEPEKKSLWS